MYLRSALVLSLAISLPGCIQLYKPLDPQTQARIKQFRAENIVVQDEVIIRAQAPGVSAAAGGGLIPALIDSAIADKRQNEIQEVSNAFYKSTGLFDVRRHIATEAEKLKSLCPDKIASNETTPLALNLEQRARVQKELSTDQAFLAFDTNFTFTPDYKRFFMMVTATVWLKENDAEPAYQNRLIYESKSYGNGLQDSIGRWGADAGKAYKDEVSSGMNDLMHLLAIDLKCQAVTDNKNPKTAQANSSAIVLPYTVAFQNTPATIEGQLISESQDRVYLRSAAGLLYSLPIAP